MTEAILLVQIFSLITQALAKRCTTIPIHCKRKLKLLFMFATKSYTKSIPIEAIIRFHHISNYSA